MQVVRNERGIALAVAIVGLVVVGALVAAAFFVGMQEQRVGRNTQQLQRALSAAEEGAALRIANWDPFTTNYMAIGDSLPFGGVLVSNSGWYRGHVYRLDDLLYLVASEGFSPDSQARQRVGVLARLRPIEVDIRAGLETQGVVDLDGQGIISGADAIPPNWTGCTAPTDTLAAIRINDPTGVTESPNNKITLEGGVEGDASIDSTSLLTFGDATFDDLRLMATKILTIANFGNQVQPSATGGVCNTSLQTNWGEPGIAVPGSPLVSACASYFPILYSPGDLTVNGNKGQGVLIVNGNLNVQGAMQFNGPVIVRGTVTISGAGGNPANFYGGIIAANVVVEDNSLSGNANINFSRCAIDRAMAGGAVAWPVQERSWVNLY